MHLILRATIDCTTDIVTVMARAVLFQAEQQVSDTVKTDWDRVVDVDYTLSK